MEIGFDGWGAWSTDWSHSSLCVRGVRCFFLFYGVLFETQVRGNDTQLYSIAASVTSKANSCDAIVCVEKLSYVYDGQFAALQLYAGRSLNLNIFLLPGCKICIVKLKLRQINHNDSDAGTCSYCILSS